MDILKNKLYKLYNKLTRYSETPIYYNTVDAKYLPSFPIELDKSTGFILHTVIAGDTYDSLALYYYGNPTYYWIIADFNNCLDPFEFPTVGKKLKIPTFQYIKFNV